MSALAMAYWHKPKAALIHHADRGSRYASYDYQDMLKDFEMICSVNGIGNCYDNAITETVFHSLKMELIFGTYFATIIDAKSAILAYIEELYNRKRKHSSLNYCSPVKFEQQYEMFDIFAEFCIKHDSWLEHAQNVVKNVYNAKSY